MKTKRCSACKKYKKVESFSKDTHAPTKLTYKCKACNSTACKNYHHRNKEKILKRKKESHFRNPEFNRKRWREYNKKNPEIRRFLTAKRRSFKLKASPPWLTEEDIEDIKAFYVAAKQLEILASCKLEVDHIIPLQGKEVCGLHVPWNLQLLTAEENIAKGNKLNV